MSTIYRMPKGPWRAEVRCSGRYISQCFVRRKDAEDRALKVERPVGRGESVSKNIPDDLSTFAHLIDLHIAEMLEVDKALRRSKTCSPDKLKAKLGHVRLEVLGRERIIQFACERRAEGAGPPTISADIACIETVLLHVAAVHGCLSAQTRSISRVSRRNGSALSARRRRVAAAPHRKSLVSSPLTSTRTRGRSVARHSG